MRDSGNNLFLSENIYQVKLFYVPDINAEQFPLTVIRGYTRKEIKQIKKKLNSKIIIKRFL